MRAGRSARRFLLVRSLDVKQTFWAFRFAALVGFLMIGNWAMAQQAGTSAAAASTVSGESAAPASPRVFVTDSDSWQMSGSSGAGAGAGAGHFSGGARPQTAEVIKTMGQRCPRMIVNNRSDASDYILRLEHEGGKGMLAHKDKVVVFVRTSGDSIFSKSTLSVGGAVQDACAAIQAHWGAHGQEIAALRVAGGGVMPAQGTAGAAAAAATMASLTIDASVPNSDIEVDGSFVGSTPSTVSVTPGKHTIAVKRKGFADWSRTMVVSGSGVRLNAEMEPTSGGGS